MLETVEEAFKNKSVFRTSEWSIEKIFWVSTAVSKISILWPIQEKKTYSYLYSANEAQQDGEGGD